MLQSLFILNVTMGNICNSVPKVDPDSAWKQQNKESKENPMYYFADLQKGGCLVETFKSHLDREGREKAEEAVRALVKRDMAVCLYNNGKGKRVTCADYIRWKCQVAAKRRGVVFNENTPDRDLLMQNKEDRFNKIEDHPACWKLECRGGVGETPMHLLFLMDSYIHNEVGYIILDMYPSLALDFYEGDEYYGESCLHIAIVYGNFELVKKLVECGADVTKRATGQFFLPEDQKRGKSKKQTNYDGYAYYGEYPLAFACCFGNREIYDYLLEHGADPDAEDTFGNTVLHMAVIANQVEMYKYAFHHPKKPAKPAIKNAAKLTPLTLASKLGRNRIFLEMLELSSVEMWRFSNIMCSVYPLAPLDTISPTGETNWQSALWFIINGETDEHLDMLEGGVVSQLLEDKWKTFAQRRFFQRFALASFHLLMVSLTVYLRPPDKLLQYRGTIDAFRFIAEITTTFGCGINSVMSLLEIRSQGLMGFFKNCRHAPAKTIFLLSCLLMVLCVPCRLLSLTLDPVICQKVEDTLMIIAVPCAWIFLLFFARVVHYIGPYVVMLFLMVSEDLLKFTLIYLIFILQFAQGFFFLFRDIEDKSITSFDSLDTTIMTLIQMTLGEFRYEEFDSTHYSFLTKAVFAVFMIIVPILLLNMLIAMMGNTYQQVISKSEKEWRRQRAKIVIVLERAFHKDDLRKFQDRYSVQMGKPANKEGVVDDEESEKHYRGLMVIKTCNKTKAKQRKGASNNWKRLGREVMRQLKEQKKSGKGGPLELKKRKKRSKHRSTSREKKHGDDRPSSGESGNMASNILSAMDQLAWAQNVDYVQGQSLQRRVSHLVLPDSSVVDNTDGGLGEGKPPIDKRHKKSHSSDSPKSRRRHRNQVAPAPNAVLGSPLRSVHESPLLSLPSEASLDFLKLDSEGVSKEGETEDTMLATETSKSLPSLISQTADVYTIEKEYPDSNRESPKDSTVDDNESPTRKRKSPKHKKESKYLSQESLRDSMDLPDDSNESPSRKRKSPKHKKKKRDSPSRKSPQVDENLERTIEDSPSVTMKESSYIYGESPQATGESPSVIRDSSQLSKESQDSTELGARERSPSRHHKKDKKKDKKKAKGSSMVSLNSASSQTSLLQAQADAGDVETPL